MSNDNIKMNSGAAASLSKDAVRPHHPCILCGKETLPHKPNPLTGEDRRICSNDKCIDRIVLLAEKKLPEA